mgnify:CR=1 FL=1|jgi:hypothetical protein
METILKYTTPSTHKIGFLWFLPLYCLTLTGAYILASTVFPVTIGKDKILGFALSQEQTVNEPLFVHLTTGIFFIALTHLITRMIGVKISTGNAILALLLTVNIFCFVIGINIPMLNTTKLWIIKEHISLTQVLSNLKMKGEMQLYYIMLIFTFIIPVLKMVAMAYDIFLSKADGRKNLILSLLSKWAMLDVMIVGVFVSTMKSGSGFAEMTTGAGLSFFVLSIILSLIISIALPYTKNN